MDHSPTQLLPDLQMADDVAWPDMNHWNGMTGIKLYHLLGTVHFLNEGGGGGGASGIRLIAPVEHDEPPSS